jgi:protein tyrosine/serine phosphatase
VAGGGHPSNLTELRWLKSHGFRTIIDLQGIAWQAFPGETPGAIEDERQQSQRLGMRFLHMPLPAAKELDAPAKALLLKVAAAMNNPALQPVYIHCNVGADRTGVAVAAFRVLYQGCSFESAKEELYSHGHPFTPMFVGAQMKFVQTLEAQRTVPQDHCPLQ